ncbi:unnamed protein product [Spirodela intermedia]|uniref:Uncharacterized protein n=1 Tax=Spirodela intermedia TaxID=51605 RepID=A0A7I8IZC0_SPIIN|nr:unnamed protein product [Spirodela intermedia]CAA6663237.1 unnamed protein product [Spirodela intermedia]
MTSSIDVNEEYRKALRTRSYVEVWTKIHRHLRRSATAPSPPSTPTAFTIEDDHAATTGNSLASSETSTSSFQLSCYSHLSSFLLKPNNQEVLLAGVPDPELRAILLDYFTAGEEACNICVSLLGSIDRLRRDHRIIQRFLNDSSATAVDCADLASYAELENPLSSVNFNLIHHLYDSLIRRLNLAGDSFARRARLLRRAKTASGAALVVACGVLAAAALAVAAHAAVAVAVAGARPWMGTLRSGRLARLLAQVEAAARGAYIMNRDMETMSRMAERLQDEVDHGKAVVRLFLRSREAWVLREAVGGRAGGGEGGYLERVDELEEHVYWCLLTINRTRALLAQEIVVGASPTPPPTT